MLRSTASRAQRGWLRSPYTRETPAYSGASTPCMVPFLEGAMCSVHVRDVLRGPTCARLCSGDCKVQLTAGIGCLLTGAGACYLKRFAWRCRLLPPVQWPVHQAHGNWHEPDVLPAGASPCLVPQIRLLWQQTCPKALAQVKHLPARMWIMQTSLYHAADMGVSKASETATAAESIAMASCRSLGSRLCCTMPRKCFRGLA